MIKPTPTKTSSTRERILLTAYDLFYQQGIRATGVDKVIAESGVAKLTFYRQFPSKNDLVGAFLERRHQIWMDWFSSALQRHGGNVYALVPVMTEWFGERGYRGCAFINTVGELSGDLPEVVEIARRHKQDMTQVIANLLPNTVERQEIAQTLAMAVDGAIIRAQYDQTPDTALAALERIVRALFART
ncbi:TetR/AcrR family transcriptional regulator [Halothiobacillus neapolitanus]|uniref:Transcriptional regulator, TetR family n=1 Tax=Halothiobacillus neapolitanus (strain ATCC 23641 / DSM 15147 / CIP 104769 / NCIMB 8539 / c2) TaxID=555778 RepID=D0L162_HALNC|nr:TetR/AcrR family transcriptional regulator [Halothiobacillus neapolitanus]ACX96435.1 transcriptional regulator, TetR family [Halothiobacillus neapolitanus c2]TDN66750.1 TetR family transcriptional regulator [Halothiobacillus neapolitanus]